MKPTLLRKVALLGVRSPYSKKVLRTASANIISYWPMNEGYGTTLIDRASGRNVTGTGISWAAGAFPGEAAPVFAGADNANLYSAGLATAWGTGAAISIVCWVNWGTTDSGVLIEFTDGTGSLALMLLPSSVTRFYYTHDGLTEYTYSPTLAGGTELRWHMMGLVLSQSGNFIRSYVDGIQGNAGTVAGVFVPNAATITAGAITSRIAHLALWNTALTATQMASLARP